MQDIVRDLEGQPFSGEFLLPIPKKEAPDYYEVIATPMDLHSMKVSLQHSKLFYLVDKNICF